MSFELSVQTSDDGARVATLRLGGNATVDQALKLRGRLEEALAAADRVDLLVAELEEADVSFLQLVVAARESARAAGKTWRLAGVSSRTFAKSLEAAGIVSAQLCDAEALP